MIQVAVLGYGTVGSGVVEVVQKNADVIEKRVGDKVGVKYILDLREFPGDANEALIVHDVNVILDDPDVDIVCETMGGAGAAYKFTKEALLKGKSACTSNKELVALHGPELLAIAKEHNASYLFEASVGGGIPIIRTILEALTAEKIDEIQGILNGTTNYILTKMEREGADFEAVLKEAQEKGYAEKDPTADIEGFDAVRKIAILSSLVAGKHVNFEKIYTEGITAVTPVDFAYAKALKRTVKLVAMSKYAEGKWTAMVSPRMISYDNPLYCAQDVFNAVLLHSNMLDYSMYYGRGAGKLPTASAVVGDVIELAKNIGRNINIEWVSDEFELAGKDNMKQKYFVRMTGSIESESANVEKAFGKVEFVTIPEADGEFGFITEELTEKQYEDYAKGFDTIIKMIRV